MMDAIYRIATYIFDPLHHFYEHPKVQSRVAGILVFFFVGALISIECNRQGWLPPELAAKTPTSHYMAINLAFTLVLILEVISLIFTLPCSISKAVGKQFEILALILIRSSFKELTDFPEPISLDGHMDALINIISDGTGALVIFAILGLYEYIRRGEEDELKKRPLFQFVAAKKIVALLLLAIFTFMAGYNIWSHLHGIHTFDFFQAFYTVLIFSDILLVLISQQYLPDFRAVFRNSGFALATLLIRLALSAPPIYNAIIGVGSALFAVSLTIVYNRFYTRQIKKNESPNQ